MVTNVFNQQSLLTISAETEVALSLDITTKILYEKPSGEKGAFNGQPDGTKIVYNVNVGDIDEAGVWKFQAYIKDTNNREGYGEIFNMNFKNNLK